MASRAFRKVDGADAVPSRSPLGDRTASPGSPRLAYLDRDRGLVEAAQRDLMKFDALYRKYLAQVYSLAYYELGDHYDAEDATERTFVAALGALPRFEERARPADGEGASTFRVWLFRIARNAISTQRRERARRRHLELGAAAALPAASDLAEDRATADEAAGAMAAVRRLPGDRRRALLMRFVDEMTTAEIAGVLDKSEGAVRVLIHRGLRTVARQLRPDAR